MERSLRQICALVHVSTGASLEAFGQTVAAERIEPILRQCGIGRGRQRKLPMVLVVWLCVAMNLFATDALDDVLRKLMQGPRFLRPLAPPGPASKGAISQRRQQLGVAPMVAVFRQVCVPLATPQTRDAFLFGLRLMALDGTTEDVPDTPANARYFGYAGGRRGHSAFPQVDAVYLAECGTHAICDAGFWPSQGRERTRARRFLRSLGPGMRVLWDAGLHSFDLCQGCVARGAHFLARVGPQLRLVPRQRLADGSYLADLRPSDYWRRKRGACLPVRVMEYQLNDPGRPGHGQRRRLITSLLDPTLAPAHALACAYHERWEVELVIDEIDTHQRPARQPLRSRTPLGVLQELYGLLLAHYAVRAVMHQAALRADLAPDRLSFSQTLRVLRNAVFEAQIVARPPFAAWYDQLLTDLGRLRLPHRDDRSNPRVVRRKMSNFDLKRDKHRHLEQPTKPFAQAVVIVPPSLQPTPVPLTLSIWPVGYRLPTVI